MDSSDSDREMAANQFNEYIAMHPNWSINNTRSLNLHHNGLNKNEVNSDSDSDDDTINLDNPSYLKKMCGGFVDTIKDKNETINMYRKMVINSNLQLVQMDSFYRRKLRTFNLTKLKFGDPNTKRNNCSDATENFTRNDPLTLFPEEVWTILLSQVTDVKDLLSLSQTCILFQKILNQTKNQWLFVNVFPYIYNQLSRKDILQCRLVCKQWLFSVDRFLENYKLLPTYSPGDIEDNLQTPKTTLKPFLFDYGFLVPFTQNPVEDSSSDDESLNDAVSVYSFGVALFRPKNKFLDVMKTHQSNRNPFVGRSIGISEDLEGNIGGNLQQFVVGSKSILCDFGQNIWHLSLNCCSGMQTPLDLWRVLNCALEKCENLKSLCISGYLNGRSLQGLLSASELGIDRPSLEIIRIGISSRCMYHLQDKLVSKFSSQLKRFEVKIWREGIYDTLDWGSLRELSILKGNCQVIMESLMKTERMRNLRKLTITISLNGNGNILEELVKLTQKFSNLSDLVLKFVDPMGATATTLKKLCDERLPSGVIGSKNLTCLEIYSDSYEIVSYDFILYFPYLSRLTIKHCHRKVGGRWFSGVEGGTSKRKMSEDVESKGILNFCKYLAAQIDHSTGEYDLGKKIYGKANIWGYLPFLKEFTVFKGSLSERYRKVFRRDVYEYVLKNKSYLVKK